MRLVHSRYAKISVEFLDLAWHIGSIESDKVHRGRVAIPQHPRLTSVLSTVRVKSPDRRTKKVLDGFGGLRQG
jgi:hypothetical protein